MIVKAFLLVSVCVALLGFLPLIVDSDLPSNLDDFQNDYRSSFLLDFSYAFLVGSCTPLASDIVLDWLYSLSRTSGGVHGKFMLRLYLLISLLFPALMYYPLRFSEHENLVLYVSCSMVARRICTAVPLFLFLMDVPSSGPVFTLRRILFPMFCMMFYPIVMPYFSNELGSIGLACRIIGIGLLVLGIVAFLVLVVMYICYLKSMDWKLSKELATIVYLLSVVLLCISAFSGCIAANQLASWSIGDVVCQNVLLSVIAIFPILLPAKLERIRELDEAINLLSMKKSFVRYVSHEIRTPLNVASVGLQLLGECDRMLDNVPNGRQVFAQIEDAIEVAIEILNDLLNYDKITSNLMTLDTTNVDPFRFVRECMALFEVQALFKNITLTFSNEMDPEEGTLCDFVANIDVYKMKQVVRNFLSNALKFTPRNGTISVKVSRFLFAPQCSDRTTNVWSRRVADVVPPEWWFRLEVKDSGAGIDPKNLPRIFNEIVQFEANKLQEGKGTGLGLYISRGIVELHGGRVHVESEGVGKGCCFSLELPLINRNDPVAEASVVQKRETKNSAVYPNLDPWAPIESKSIEHSFRSSRYRSSSSGASSEMHTGRLGTARRRSGGADEVWEPRSFRSGRILLPSVPSSTSDRDTASDPTFRAWTSAPRVSFRTEADAGAAAPSSKINSSFISVCRALVVDDSVMSAKMVAQMLKRNDIDCDVAGSGEEAVDCFLASVENQQPYNFIVTDNHMDGMSGMQLCQKLRQLGFMNPIFGVTGDSSPEDCQCFLDAGATAVFVKPLKPSNFEAMLETVAS